MATIAEQLTQLQRLCVLPRFDHAALFKKENDNG